MGTGEKGLGLEGDAWGFLWLSRFLAHGSFLGSRTHTLETEVQERKGGAMLESPDKSSAQWLAWGGGSSDPLVQDGGVWYLQKSQSQPRVLHSHKK
jgi:hypothetical protein